MLQRLTNRAERIVIGGLVVFGAIDAALAQQPTVTSQEASTVGRRADLLLLEGNPFEDMARLKQPLGVVVRGRWLTREVLNQMLATLAKG